MDKEFIELKKYIILHWEEESDTEIAEKFSTTKVSVRAVRYFLGIKRYSKGVTA